MYSKVLFCKPHFSATNFSRNPVLFIIQKSIWNVNKYAETCSLAYFIYLKSSQNCISMLKKKWFTDSDIAREVFSFSEKPDSQFSQNVIWKIAKNITNFLTCPLQGPGPWTVLWKLRSGCIFAIHNYIFPTVDFTKTVIWCSRVDLEQHILLLYNCSMHL